MGFKVGDKVRVLDVDKIRFGRDYYFTGMETEVVEIFDDSIHLNSKDNRPGIFIRPDEFDAIELIEPKITKNQRITTLETEVSELKNEVAELKLIVHQLREPNKEIVAANLKFESKTIEFEGAKYRKVNREALDGDVVILRNSNVSWFANGIIRKVLKGTKITDDEGDVYGVYHKSNGRWKKEVEVYELIVEDKQQIKGVSVVLDNTKSTNQLRAEIIEKAKFLTSSIDDDCFVINEEKRTVVLLTRRTSDNKVHSRSIAKCMPSDVFNEHIGKAIALGRALNLDVSEFEQAVQPNFIEIGMIVKSRNDIICGVEKVSDEENFSLRYSRLDNMIIINDTNAIYSEVK